MRSRKNNYGSNMILLHDVARLLPVAKNLSLKNKRSYYVYLRKNKIPYNVLTGGVLCFDMAQIRFTDYGYAKISFPYIQSADKISFSCPYVSAAHFHTKLCGVLLALHKVNRSRILYGWFHHSIN